MTLRPDEQLATLRRLVAREDLSEAEARALAETLVAGEVPPGMVAALLVALATKVETTDELVGFARVLRDRCRKFPGPREAGAIDVCGTGGAKVPSFNISTVGAFVVAAAGLPVAKHGNVSARGPCGSTDLLTALGLPVARSIRFAKASWEEQRLTFLHAPLYHAATGAVAPVRKTLGVRTIFNQLGPLTNPADVKCQVVGAYSPDYARRAGPAFRRLGVEKVMLFHSESGLDEFSSLERSTGYAYGRGDLLGVEIPPDGVSIQFEPTLLGEKERWGSLAPRPPAEAAAMTEEVLQGRGEGAVRGSVLLTAGAALWLAGKDRQLSDGVRRARETLVSGAAYSKLKALQELARREAWES